MTEIFKRQTSDFWDYQWAAAKLLEIRDENEARGMLAPGCLDDSLATWRLFSELVRKKWNFEFDARGLLYSGSHQLAQAAIAGRKARKKSEAQRGAR